MNNYILKFKNIMIRKVDLTLKLKYQKNLLMNLLEYLEIVI